MAQHVIHPIALAIRGRTMAESVYRPPVSLGPVSVIGLFTWYIEGPKQKILVDSGTTYETYQKAGMLGSTHVQTLEQGLGKYGLKPTDIDIVIETHLHGDHIDLCRKYTNAKFILQQAEFDYHSNPPSTAVDPKCCPKDILDTLNWQIVKGDYQVCEGVRTIFTPGHTPGGQSVAVDTAKGLAIIDSLCTTDPIWNVPAAMQAKYEFFCPGIHSDTLQAVESLRKIKKTAAIRVPIHEVRWAFIESIPAKD